MQTLSWRLRRLKEKRCWTDDAIAEAAEIARLTVHRVLNGKTWPDLVTIHRLEKVMEQRLWVNTEFPWDVGEIGPHHFHYRSRRGSYIGFVDNDQWEAEVYPTDNTQGWRWEARRLTNEGWRQDGEGTATDADAAIQAVDQHVAERVAAEAPPSGQQQESPDQSDAR